MTFVKKTQSKYAIIAVEGSLERLRDGAAACLEGWGSEEAIDWTDATALVERCKKALNDAGKATKPLLKKITEYANAIEDWDSGEVANWPLQILDALEKDGVR
jgi:hypothetical protein